MPLPHEAAGAPARRPAPTPRGLAATYRLFVVAVLGFASGLPLALSGQALQAWLSMEGLDIATIGFLSLVGLPYTFKFLWAPLMDRFELLPRFGRRRGWLVFTQLLTAGALLALAATPPQGALQAFALLAVVLAFISASQDVVIDAYRTDLLPAAERGLGSSVNVLGYRLAMIVSGGVALIWTDAAAGSGMSWPQVYRIMAAIMAGAALFSAVALPRLSLAAVPSSVARNDVIGFVAVLAAAVTGYLFTRHLANPLAGELLGPWLRGGSLSPALQTRWVDLLALGLGIVFTLPLATWAARRARFETLLGGVRGYFSQPGATAFLFFIVLYKLTDAFAMALLTPFLLQAMHFSPAEVGVVNKVIGLWVTIGGALLGGVLMLHLKLWRSLMLFGLLQGLGNLAFWWLATQGKGSLPGLVIPAFDFGIVQLKQATQVDGGLLLAVVSENLTSGMGTAAFVAFLMSLTQQRFTATQFALLSAFASVGRVWVGPLAGVLASSIGWPRFFVLAAALAIPPLVLLWVLRDAVRRLEADPAAG
ncbi:MAG: MFS transporter [Ideonella sp.]|nr:MFS transporter [Ideonella sp.]